jgi:DNA-binding MarR family transcriptional regulator
MLSNTKDAYQITWLVRRLFRAMAQVSEASLQDAGITVSQRAVLEFLYPDQELTVPQVAERYAVSRQHVQVTVNSLAQSGLLQSKENPRHKRSPLLRLSGPGRELFERIIEQDRITTEQLFDGIPDEERERVRAAMELLLERLNERANS